MSTVQPKELSDVFRENVVRLRKLRGMTQADLAKKLTNRNDRTVHVPYVSNVESGTTMPGLAMIAMIAEALDVHPSELMREKKSQVPT